MFKPSGDEKGDWELAKYVFVVFLHTLYHYSGLQLVLSKFFTLIQVASPPLFLPK